MIERWMKQAPKQKHNEYRRLPLIELYQANKDETIASVQNAICAVVFYRLHMIPVIHIGTEKKEQQINHQIPNTNEARHS